MKKNISLLMCLLMTLSITAAPKWQSLFNGKDFTGWKKIGVAEYKIENGAIVGISTLAAKTNSFLVTEKEYGDFILEMEFKIDDGLNSGVQFRSHSKPEYKNGRVHGYQYEFDPSPRAWTGGIYDESRRGWLYSLQRNPGAQTLYKKGEWNKMRIEAFGTSIRTWLNGEPVADVIDDKDSEGFIALQVHAIKKAELDGLTISWRDIRILTNKAAVKAKTPQDKVIAQANWIDNTISEREAEEGWQLLWNGKNLDGWMFKNKTVDVATQRCWEIEDGELIVGRADAAGNKAPRVGDIITTKGYKNFELTVDFYITKGANGGIKYFVDPAVNAKSKYGIGCEFQILDDKNHPDADKGFAGNRKLGSLYDLIPAPSDKPYRARFYNTAKIVVKGNHVEHWLNHVKILEYTRGDAQWDELVRNSKFVKFTEFGKIEVGHILIQEHSDEVHYKNIKIRELN